MTPSPSLTAEELRSVFTPSPDRRELVGIEVEVAPLDPRTGHGVPFEGERGIEAFLAAAASALSAEPVREVGRLVGLALPDGAQVSLENGGAVEYSTPPLATVVDAVDNARDGLGALAAVAADHGFALVPGANFPFDTVDDVHWVPNARGDLMRRHFADLGDAGAYGRQALSLTLSTQVNFDYLDEADLVAKLRMLAAVSTPATALFANSPLEGGRPSGALSRRMQFFTRFDSTRDRVVPATLGDVTLDGFLEWVLSIPMVYRKLGDGTCAPAPDRPFSDLLRHGFDDGQRPGMADWAAHLSQVYSDVRVRRTLEARAVDGPPYAAFGAVPAFWAGLTYHAPSRTAAWELVRDADLAEHLAALDDIAVRGLRARFAGASVRELVAKLLRLSEAGLRARVAAGLEHGRALDHLDPLREVVDNGETFAERVLRTYNGPEDYVATYGVPVRAAAG